MTLSELLMMYLKRLFHDKLIEMRNRPDQDPLHELVVSEREFMHQARRLKVKDLSSFYSSTKFQHSPFTYDAENRVIIQRL